MDLKSSLNGYFEETQLPPELSPDRIAGLLKPRTPPKKAVEIREDAPKPAPAPAPKPAAVPTPAPKPAVAPSPAPKPAAAPVPAPKPAAVPVPKPAAVPVPKPAPAPKPAEVTFPVPKPAPAPAPQPQPQQKEEQSQPPELNASAFIKIVRHHHLTGSEFLGLLGNTKISNKAYQEIESNPDLTVKRLIEILEESPLTSADYEKLAIAVQRTAKLKEEAKAKLGTPDTVSGTEPSPAPAPAPAPKPAPAPMPAPKPEPTSAPAPKPEPTPAPKPEPTPAPAPAPSLTKDGETAPTPAPTPDQAEKNEEEGEEPEKKEETKAVGTPMPRLFEEDEVEDLVDFDPDDGSNRGKFIASALAAVFLIALSFGLRWYFTGSWLPSSEVQAVELELDENGIFEALSALPAPAAPAFAENKSYTAGGSVGEKALLSSVTLNNRFIYFADNTLYIFEKLGGQLEQLDARKYDEGINILGLLKLDSGIAVVTAYEGDAYGFSYTLPPENEGEGERTVDSSVQRPETVIELLDSEKPENRSGIRLFRLSGSLADLWTEGDRITAVTGESLAQGAAAQDAYSFMPYVCSPYADGDGKTLCPAGNVLIPEKMQYGGFVTIFTLDALNGAAVPAAVAGGSGQLVSRSGSDLFIVQGDLLARYDLSSGIAENGICALSGTVGGFSAVGVYGNEIRITVLEDGSAALEVLDSRLGRISEVKNLGNGETPLATCFNGKETYLVTESGTLYGIDGENEPMTASTAGVTQADIYKWSDSIGVRIEPLGDQDRRTGLSVSALSLNGSVSVVSTLEISSRTVAEQAMDEYLSSPAETDIYALGASPEDGILVVPVVYFDGVSEVERFVICTLTQQGNLSFGASICEYDRQSSKIFASVDGDTVTAVTGDRLITAKASDGSIIGYFSSRPPSGIYSYAG